MAELSKQALKVDNNQSFPNNNNGAITPSILRAFNTNMIDSNVNQTSFDAYTQSMELQSASFDQRVDSLESFTASLSTAFVSTGSFNAYTASVNGKFNDLQTTTASMQNSISALNAYTASDNSAITNLNQFTQSANTQLTNLASSQSIDNTKWNTLGTQSGSWVTESESGSFLITASVNLNTITFTKGDATTFAITVNTGSGGGTADLTSLNAFTASQLTINTGYNTYTSSTNGRLTNIESTTASLNSSITQLNASSASQQVSINALNVFTASQSTASIVSSITNLNQFTSSANGRLTNLELTSASLLVETQNLELFSASALVSISNLNANTASQQSQINSLINATASYANSASVALVDANQQSQINALIAVTGSFLTSSADITQLNAFTASQLTINSGYNTFTQSANQRLNSIESVSGSWITESETASFARTNVDNNFTANQTFTNITAVSASFQYVQTTFETASVIYSSGSNQFGDELSDIQTLSGSVLIVGSGSINGQRILTIADTGSFTFNTGSFATTGSNTFVGDQTISGSLLISGSEVIVGELTSSRLRVNSNTSLGGTLSVSNDTTMTGDLLIQSTSPKLKLRDTSGGGFSSGYDLTINTGSFIINDETHDRPILSDIYNTSTLKHTTELTSEIIVISGSTSVTLIGNVSASIISASTINGLGDPLAFSTSVDSRLDSLESTSASLLIETQNLELFSASALTSLSNLNTATASLFTSASLSLTTASFSGNTLTFRKGDGTTFGIVIPDVSGSTINTASFATTGSNIFVGDQTIQNNLYIQEPNNPLIYTQFLQDPLTNKLQVNQVGASGIILNNIDVNMGQLTASLQEGYVWVGDSTGRTVTVATSSFGTTINTGSLLTTASFNTYTASNDAKVNSLIAKTGSYITTGSATSASQTILGDFKFDTTYITNNPYVSGVGGAQTVEVSYGDIFNGTTSGNDFIFWLDTNFAGVTVSGSGITNGNITGYGFSGNGAEVYITAGTITNGATYTFTGPAIQTIDITGSLGVTKAIRVSSNNSTSNIINNNITNTNSNFSVGMEAGAVNVQTIDSTDRLYMNISSSVFNAGAEWPGAQFSTVYNGAETSLIGFQTQNTWTDGTITILRPLFVSSSLNVKNTLTASLQEGYVWVGNASGKTTTVATSSFGSVINTGSFATTGSNNFVGNQVFTGSLIQSSSNSITTTAGNAVGTLIKNRIEFSGGNGDDSPTARIFVTGTDGRLQTLGGSFQSIDSTRITGSAAALGAAYQAYANPISGAANLNIGVFTADTFETDIELNIVTDITGTRFMDWDNGSTFNYVPFMTLAPNNGDNPPVNFKRSISVTGSVSITNVMNLKAQDPLPTGTIGDLAVSGSHIYFYNGAWTQLD